MSGDETTPSDAHHGSVEIAPNRDARQALSATKVIRELAEEQHGVVARHQLLDLGVSQELVKGRVISGALIPLYEGVFSLGHAKLSRLGRWMAAVLATGPRSVLSHGSAAELWGLRRHRGLPEVSRRSGGTTRSGVRLHQTRILEGAEMTVEAGIPVTSIERTLMDIATELDDRLIEHAIVAADRAGRLRWEELQRLLARTPRRAGAGRLRRVANRISPHAVDARSPLEVDFLALCRESQLPEPQVNVLVHGLLVDFVWPGQRVVVETDGYAYHRNRLAFERDRERTVALSAAGYQVHRATYAMLNHDPDPFMKVVRKSLDRAGASRLGAISTER